MKIRHRVSQVVGKLICSTGGRHKILKQGAANCGEYRQVIGVTAALKAFESDQRIATCRSIRPGRAAPIPDHRRPAPEA
jgi:hypothetical protein